MPGETRCTWCTRPSALPKCPHPLDKWGAHCTVFTCKRIFPLSLFTSHESVPLISVLNFRQSLLNFPALVLLPPSRDPPRNLQNILSKKNSCLKPCDDSPLPTARSPSPRPTLPQPHLFQFSSLPFSYQPQWLLLLISFRTHEILLWALRPH